MTQDQPGQAQGTDYVVRGEVVPDDETEAFEAEQSGPMTHLRKAASALRGAQADQTAPDQALPDQTVPNPADDAGAARSPDTEDRAYRDEQDMRETAPVEGVPAGKHAAENAGLRPGEATDRLGDFGDIAFGNLLPDAGQYSAQAVGWRCWRMRRAGPGQRSIAAA